MKYCHFNKKNSVSFRMDLNSRAKFIHFCDLDLLYKFSLNK